MKCPHCLVSFHEDQTKFQVNVRAQPGNSNDSRGDHWSLVSYKCPACDQFIFYLIHRQKGTAYWMDPFMIYPKGVSRSPLPPEVSDPYAADYKEACLTLSDSPKASAALSRRCLQSILRDKAGVKKADLFNEIDEVIASKQLPSYLAESIDAVRNIGAFATHPIKSKNTGEIVEVEPGEAEWNLNVIEGLFDFYFVQPALMEKKKKALDKKLTDAGKPPMKK